MPRSLRRVPFVGRQRELAALLERLEATGQSQGDVVLLAGEPGIGKTQLVLELTDRARAQSWQVLVGRAYEPDGMPPYLPFAEALRDYVRACPLDDLRTQLGEGAAFVALLIPELRKRLPDVSETSVLSPEHQRYRLFESVCDFLLAIARSPRGLGALLVLEDLHWADRPSLLLLQHLARRLADAPLLVVGTHRTVDVDREHPLVGALADLTREGFGERLQLACLSVQEVAALTEQVTGAPVASSVVDAIHRTTEGNPLFVREVLRELEAQGRDLGDARTATIGWSVPERLRQVIGKRLARLSPESSEALRAVAVLGDGCAFDILAAMAELPTVQLLDALDEGTRAGVIREARDGYYFTHALIRQTLYDDLSLHRQQWLHLRAAEAIERVHAGDLDRHLASLAGHYQAAGVVADARKTLDALRRAGDAAWAVCAWEEAAAHWQAGLKLSQEQRIGNEAQRCEVRLALGGAQARAGDLAGARQSFLQAAESARAAQASEVLARAALGLADEAAVPGMVERILVDPVLVSLLEEALAALGSADSKLRVALLARLARALFWSVAREQKELLSRQAVEMAQRIGDKATLASALRARRTALWSPDDLEERLATATEIVHLAEEVGDSELTLQGRHYRIVDLLELGDIRAVDSEIEAYARLVETLRVPLYLWSLGLFRGMRAMLAGQLGVAERLIQETSVTGQRAHPLAAVAFAMQEQWLRRLQGRMGELEGYLKQGAERYATLPSWRCSLAVLYSDQGRVAEARSEFERLAVDEFAVIPRDHLWLHCLTVLAEVCTFLGDDRRAATLYELLLPYADRTVVPGNIHFCAGSVAYYLGLLDTAMSRWDDAEMHFDAALDRHARMNALPLMAHTQYAHAAMLLARGRRSDRHRARELLEG